MLDNLTASEFISTPIAFRPNNFASINVVPLGMNSMQKFVDAGFKLKEIVIKEQHNCRSTDYWEGKERKFLMLAHEYIFILEKADDHNPI